MNPDELFPSEGSGQPLRAKPNGQVSPADALMTELTELAERFSVDPSFAAALERRLRQRHPASVTPPAPTLWQRLTRSLSMSRPAILLRPRLGYLVALALLLSLLVSIPVLAHMGGLKYFVPDEVTTYPTPRGNSSAAFVPLRPSQLTELEKAVGFSILWPSYLPSACQLLQSSQVGNYRVVWLSYSCFDLYEAKQQSDWEPIKEPVPRHSIQELTINGQPALYMEDTASSTSSNFRRLIFERGDILIQLFATPGSPQNGMRAGLLSKEELITIAESMR